jgi:lysophospholipase L1-like esterase
MSTSRVIGVKAGSGAANDASGYTYHTAIVMPGQSNRVRIIIQNNNAAAATLGPFAVSTRGSDTDLNGSGGTWTPVTFGGSATVTIPGQLETNVPSVRVSDWIPITPEPNNDGLGRTIYCVRAFHPAAVDPYPSTGPGHDVSDMAALADGYYWLARRETGDHVTDPTGFTDTTNVGALGAVIGIEQAVGKTVMTVGDSIVFGTGATVLGDSFGHRLATSLSTPSVPVSNFNQAWQGMDTEKNYARLAETLTAGISPDVVVWQASDGGNVSNVARVSNDLYYARRVIELVGANKLVFMTSTPRNANTSGEDDIRRAFDHQLKLFRNSGVPVVDISELGDAAAAEDIKTAYDSGDGVHLTDAGYDLIVDRLRPHVARRLFL